MAAQDEMLVIAKESHDLIYILNIKTPAYDELYQYFKG
jgi:hypothetical protein